MNEINEKIIKLIGSASIPLELENGHDYTIISECSVVEVSDRNNDDGTINRTFKLKLFGETQLVEKGKTPIKVKVKGNTPSQLLRYALHRAWNCQPEGMDFQTYYEQRMREIIKSINDENI